MRLPMNENKKECRKEVLKELKMELTALTIFLIGAPIFLFFIPTPVFEFFAQFSEWRHFFALALSIAFYFGLTYNRIGDLHRALQTDLFGNKEKVE